MSTSHDPDMESLKRPLVENENEERQAKRFRPDKGTIITEEQALRESDDFDLEQTQNDRPITTLSADGRSQHESSESLGRTLTSPAAAVLTVEPTNGDAKTTIKRRQRRARGARKKGNQVAEAQNIVQNGSATLESDGAHHMTIKEGMQKMQPAAIENTRETSSENPPAVEEEKEKKNKKKKKKSNRKNTSEDRTVAALENSHNLARPKEQSNSSNNVLTSVQPGWRISTPSAGRFIRHDPVFVRSGDGNDFIIAANSRELQLLAVDTSLVVRTHPVPEACHVKCFAIDVIDSSLVNIACSDESIMIWNWQTGESPKKRRFQANGKVKAIASASIGDDNIAALVYISKTHNDYAIFSQSRSLYTTKSELNCIRVLDRSSYIIASGPTVLAVGMKSNESKNGYIWVELPLESRCTCFDATLLPTQASTKNSKQHPGLRVVLGTAGGQIHLFENISTLFSRGHPTLPLPRILHWHRESVSSVTFSRDRNYLISGGKETVIVLWQLATGKKQFLPHLTSEIEHIVVNQEGDRYAVQMGDNSIMVLSTSELKPVANFAGLQLCPSVINPKAPNSRPVAAFLRPTRTNELLCTVPSTQPKSPNDITIRPFLQTFDIRTSRHLSRQALTRNNVTDFNLGPEKTPIIPPDVIHLAISVDGQWMATIDEWVPPVHALHHLASHAIGLEMEQQKRREVCLKIWQWDEDQTIWTLTTKVNAPHSGAEAEGSYSGEVLSLVADPANNGFATVGEDVTVKIWRPKTRKRYSGKAISKEPANPMEWTCRRTIKLPSQNKRVDSPVDTELSQIAARLKAFMAYSQDGSILAVSQIRNGVCEAPLMHFIDTYTGDIKDFKSGPAADDVFALGFLESLFIVLSSSGVYIWELVNDSLVCKIGLSAGPNMEGECWPLLAVNAEDGTFAIVTRFYNKRQTQVEIHQPMYQGCLYRKKFETEIQAILAAKGARGYTLLFADATVRVLSPPGTAREVSLPPSAEGSGASAARTAVSLTSTADTTEVETTSLFGYPSAEAGAERKQASLAMYATDQHDHPVVRPEQLAAIFDGAQSYAMPPVRDMFHAVVGLFGRKPVTKVAPEVV